MGSTINFSGPTGTTCYGVMKSRGGQIVVNFNLNPTFDNEPYYAPHWVDYARACVENSPAGSFSCDLVSGLHKPVAGSWRMRFYAQAGATPLTTDTLLSTYSFDWDGTNILGTPQVLLENAHSAADVIGQLLVNLGQGMDVDTYNAAALLAKPVGTEWPVHVTDDPDTPDNRIVVNDTTPVSDGREMIFGEQIQHDGVQVMVCARDHLTGWPKSKAVRRALDEECYDSAVTLGGSDYLVHSVSTQNLLPLGKGESPSTRRRKFSINALLTYQRVL